MEALALALHEARLQRNTVAYSQIAQKLGTRGTGIVEMEWLERCADTMGAAADSLCSRAQAEATSARQALDSELQDARKNHIQEYIRVGRRFDRGDSSDGDSLRISALECIYTKRGMSQRR